MDINLEKIELTKEILKIQDIEIISKLKISLQSFLKNEIAKPMSVEQYHAEIEESLKDSENDNVFSNSQVKEMVKEWASK